MLPFGIGFGEVILILIVILLVVGPDKLPTIAKTVGKGVRAARRAGNELRDAVQAEEIRREVAENVRKWTDPDVVEDVELDEAGTYAMAEAEDVPKLTSLTANAAPADAPDDVDSDAKPPIATAQSDADEAGETPVTAAEVADVLTQARSPLRNQRPLEIPDPPAFEEAAPDDTVADAERATEGEGPDERA